MSENEIKLSIKFFSATADPGDLTTLFGVTPDCTWRTGERILNSIQCHKENGWQLTSGVSTGADFGEHTEALVRRLRTLLPYAETAAHNWETEISCVLYIYEGAPAAHFDVDMVALFARFNAEIDFDIYCLGERRDARASRAAV